jgi:hypothetical protein
MVIHTPQFYLFFCLQDPNCSNSHHMTPNTLMNKNAPKHNQIQFITTLTLVSILVVEKSGSVMGLDCMFDSLVENPCVESQDNIFGIRTSVFLPIQDQFQDSTWNWTVHSEPFLQLLQKCTHCYCTTHESQPMIYLSYIDTKC